MQYRYDQFFWWKYYFSLCSAPTGAERRSTKKRDTSCDVSLFPERETGLEPAAPTLARSCSTNWATRACFCVSDSKHIINIKFYESARRDSNPRPRPWQGRAPPTEPLAHKKCYSQAHGYYTIWKRICQQKKGKKLKKIQIVYAIETI